MVYFIKKDLDKSLEMKCDLSIVEKLSLTESADYLQTIVESLRAACGKNQFSGVRYSVSLGNAKNDELTERFRIVAENKKNVKKNKKFIIYWFIVFSVVWVMSYSFLFISSYDAPIEEIEDVPGAVQFTPDDSYILYENGEYYFVIEVDGKTMQHKISCKEIDEFEECDIEIRGRKKDEKSESSIFSFIFKFADDIM